MVELLKYEEIVNLPVDIWTKERIGNKDVIKFEAFKNVNLISFDLLDVNDMNIEDDKITICQTKEKIYFICENQASLEKLKIQTQSNIHQDEELYTFFSHLLRTDFDKMDDLEASITEVEEMVLKGYQADYKGLIISIRKKLLRLKKYYEQLSQIFDGVLENENHFISEENLRNFKLLARKSDRLISDVIDLRDYITQVREAYQSQTDIELNRLMKIFTIVTVIFMPMTVIVGWYGMNLQLPEYSWKHGYLFVMILNVIIAASLIVYFKKKKWF